MEKNENFTWMKTDTAAVMFTALQTKSSARICRFSAVLKNEDVNPELLRRAVYDLLPRFPYFCCSLKKGFFWGYLEHTDNLPPIEQEAQLPGVAQNLSYSGNPEFRVLYYKRRITVEGSHVIADGSGYMAFLKAITARYLWLKGKADEKNEGILHPDDIIDISESENAYESFRNNEKLTPVKRVTAYRIPAKQEKNFIQHIFGLTTVETLKEQSKKYSVTITEYVASAVYLAIIRAANSPINDTISIAVPVNMRKFYKTATLRNFSMDVPLDFNPEGITDYTIGEICDKIKGQLASKATAVNVQAFINANAGLINNPFVKVIPGFIKWQGLRIIQKKTHVNNMTLMMSNLGSVDLPQKLDDEVERIDFVGGDPGLYGLPLFMGLISLNGFTNICFSTNSKDVSVCREFFRILAENDVAVRIESSEGKTGAAVADADTRCPICDVDLGEKYLSCPLCGGKAHAEKNSLEGIRLAEYPRHYTPVKKPSAKNRSKAFTKESAKAFFSL